MIIGICGLIGSGKDTAADYLVNFHQFKRESFAGTLKDAVSDIFGWDRELLEGRTKESREWREQPDEWWTRRLKMTVTPRRVLQLWGTEVIRNGYHDDMWIASVENRLRNNKNDIVITDCRFYNEIRALKDQGAKIVCIRRGVIPHWYEIACKANRGDIKASAWLDANGIHASESSWAGTEFDAVIDNNGSIEQLYNQLKRLV